MSEGSVRLKPSELPDVDKVGLELLSKREISDGKIRNQHWFVYILTEARSIVRRRRMWKGRRTRTYSL